MFERELLTYGFQQQYASMLLDGVDNTEWNVQPFENANTPTWILGHLAVVGHRLVTQLGEPGFLEERWLKLFSPGTSIPTDDTPNLPSSQDIREAYRLAHERVTQTMPTMTPAIFSEPNPHERLKNGLPTVGDLVAFVLTAHEATHLGQLSAWRRAMGLPHAIPA